MALGARKDQSRSANTALAASVSHRFSIEEVGAICHAIATARDQLSSAAKVVTQAHSLGPRGAWMLGLIATGSVYPLDLTRVFGVGRSLITAELTRLIEAGLVTSRKSATDGRRLELALTPLGVAAKDRLAEALAALIDERLKGYTREEILHCARLLRDFAGAPAA